MHVALTGYSAEGRTLHRFGTKRHGAPSRRPHVLPKASALPGAPIEAL